MTIIKKRYGIYKKLPDSSLQQVGFDRDTCCVYSTDIVGLAYQINTEGHTVPVNIQLKYVYPNGTEKKRQHQVESNQEFVSNLIFNDTETLEEGKYIYEVEILDYPEIEPISQVFYIYKAGKSTLFSPIKATSASEDEITNFELSHKVRFCNDYRTFLLNENGFNFMWWTLPEWQVFHNQGDFWTTLSKISTSSDWIEEIHTLFGLNRPDAFYDLNRNLLSFSPQDYISIFYPIGVDGSGNPIVQIANGERKGKMLLIEHEVSAILNDFLMVKNNCFTDVYGQIHKYKFSDFKSATADELIDACIQSGAATFFNLSFKQVFQRLTIFYTLIHKKMKEHYSIN